MAGAAQAQDSVSACLITKTETNPFFVKMREGAAAKAEEIGVEFNAYAGQDEGDNEGRALATETCIANGVDGNLPVPTDTGNGSASQTTRRCSVPRGRHCPTSG